MLHWSSSTATATCTSMFSATNLRLRLRAGFLGLLVYTAILLSPAVCQETTTAAASSTATSPAVSPANGYTTTGLVTNTNHTGNITQDFFLQVLEGSEDIYMPLGSLTMITGRSLTVINGVNSLCSGPLVIYNSSQQNLKWGSVPLINCDTGDTASNLLAYINSGNNPCVLLYSLEARACSLSIAASNPLGSQLAATFTLFNGKTTNSVIFAAPLASSNNEDDAATGYIGPTQNTIDSTTGWTEANGSTNNRKSLGMGILYGVVGIVAAAFMFIMISGAIRVHRFPERYGLARDTWMANRNLGGNNGHGNGNGPGTSSGLDGNQTRSAKAKALTRAMLDSIPLVKFEVATPDHHKNNNNHQKNANDEEKAIPDHGHTSNTSVNNFMTQMDDLGPVTLHKTGAAGCGEPTGRDTPSEQSSDKSWKEPSVKSNKGDINKNVVTLELDNLSNEHSATDGEVEDLEKDSEKVSENDKQNVFYGNNEDEYICPICYEELKDGDILRILPCQHKFHALCVDPWLLNTSSLCPLCRVDLSIQRNEDIPDQPPDEHLTNAHLNNLHDDNTPGNNDIVIPPNYEVSTSLFNRFLDTWNAHLLPREARQAALQRFHEEAELRRNLLARRNSSYMEQNRTRWLRFVNHRRILHRNRNSDNTNSEQPGHVHDDNDDDQQVPEHEHDTNANSSVQ